MKLTSDVEVDGGISLGHQFAFSRYFIAILSSASHVYIQTFYIANLCIVY